MSDSQVDREDPGDTAEAGGAAGLWGPDSQSTPSSALSRLPVPG